MSVCLAATAGQWCGPRGCRGLDQRRAVAVAVAGSMTVDVAVAVTGSVAVALSMGALWARLAALIFDPAGVAHWAKTVSFTRLFCVF